MVDSKQAVVLSDQIRHAIGVVIKHSDITAGHIGDVHLVTVFDQANQSTAHTDDVVIRMWTEAQARLLLTPRGMVFNRILHPEKDAVGNPLGRAVMSQQLVQIIIAKIIVIQFEQCFSGAFTQPQHRSLDQCVSPLNVVDQPGRRSSRQRSCRRKIQQDARLHMLLQERCRHTIRDRPLQGFTNDRCLVLS